MEGRASATAPWDCDLHHPPAPTKGNERRVQIVVVLTAVTMVAELLVGYWSGSLALVADGWHMASHAGALGLSAGAYWLARARAGHKAFVFGTGKVQALAGYTNAVFLVGVAVLMVVEAIARLRQPVTIHYADALPVAIIGLVVNILSVKLLQGDGGSADEHGHDHGHSHSHSHDHARSGAGADHNMRAAYFHVLADTLTSVLAIGGLLLGLYFRWTFVDPLIAILGAGMILNWGVRLCFSAARQLLDLAPPAKTEDKVKRVLSSIDDVQVCDLHLWEIAPGRFGCVASILSATPREVGEYRKILLDEVSLSHLTLEVHRSGA